MKESTRQLVRCNCTSEFQDKTYGRSLRITTPVNKSRDPIKKKITQVRCTVCGKVHAI